jgi:thiol-disulfide isomerase/thioredoxin
LQPFIFSAKNSMGNRFKLSILGWIILLLFAQKAYTQNLPNIDITIKGLKDTTCLLAYRFGSKIFVKDSITIDGKGRGHIESDKRYGGGVYLYVLPDKQTFMEFIISDDQEFTLKTDTADLVKNMLVSGSEENELFYNYRKYVDPLGMEIGNLSQEYQDLEDQDSKEAKKIKEQLTEKNDKINDYRKGIIEDNPESFLTKLFLAMKDPEIPEIPILSNGRPDSTFQYRYFKAHYFDHMDFGDSVLLRTPIFEEKLKFYFEKMILQIPDSVIKEVDIVLAKCTNKETFRFVLQTLLIKYERSKLMGSENIFVHLALSYYTEDRAFWADSAQIARIQTRAKQLEPIMLGQKAPNLIMLDYYNNPRSLWQVDAEYTVLYFWAFDCGHCKKVTPKLKTLYEKVHPLGVEVFAVTTKQEEKGWRDYIDAKELPWINCHDIGGRNRIHKVYDIYSTPVTYLLDKNKEILAKRIDIATLRKILYQKLGLEEELPSEDLKEDSEPE